jgi:phosphatidylserine/phosphatidylglycerophosphate/cardiolipin synthase-like enzyme
VRFRSKKAGGYQVFAVAGVNTVSFGIVATPKARKGLLGFAVERFDPKEGERYIMPGFKMFRSVVPNPGPESRCTTWEHPVQSFVWDDFTAKPDHGYEYAFYPIKGMPKNLDRSTPPIRVRIHTEPLFSSLEHDIFFNRGVASSQAYTVKFGNKKPDDPTLSPEKQKEALQWLSRDLDEALLKFIQQAKKGDALRCCFYEFRYAPVAEELRKAIDKGVDVRIIVDAKVNETTDKKTGKVTPSFPREDNRATIKAARLPDQAILLREARPDAIAHNKFMVLLKGKKRVPAQVWTGSTNISAGGIHGQTNVGHWLRNPAVAERFLAYWTVLADDPGARAGDDRATASQKNAALKSKVDALNQVPVSIDAAPKGVTPVFSPMKGLKALDLYVNLVDSATQSSCITLAFGISAPFKEQLKDNTAQSQIIFMLLEKEDVARSGSKTPFIAINASNNVYKAWGAFLDDPVYQWAKETNARALQLNSHVAYIHSKFLLRDPLGSDPIVVTGSANFSEPSTTDNDENMLIIRGNTRVADIYLTEFNRLFNHYYFRAVHETTAKKDAASSDASLFLAEDDSWIAKYQPGKLKQKRLDLFAKMKGTVAG